MLCLTCLASHPLQAMMQCGCLWSLHVSLSCSYYHLTCLPTLPNRIMATYTESGMTQTIRVLGKCYSAPSAQPISGWSAFASEFIGQLDDQFPRQLIVKYAHQADFLTLKNRLDNNKWTEQSLVLAQTWWDELFFCTQSHIFIQCSIFEHESDLTIKIYKKSRRRRIVTFGRASEGDLLCQVSIKFDDLWKHLVFWITEDKKMWVDLCLNRFRYAHGTTVKFKVDFNDEISGLKFWIVAEVYTQSLSTWKFLIKFNQRLMTVTWALWMHKSRAR